MDSYNYVEFCRYGGLIVENDYLLTEISIPNFLKKQFNFIKDLAQKTSFRLNDLIKMFMNKTVFSFFTKIRWSFDKLFQILKQGFSAYKDILNAIAEYVSKTKVGKWSEENLKKLDQWLKEHPKLKKIGGVVVAGILLYIWLNMTFVGDFKYDFNLTDAVAALNGKYSLANLFAGTDGTKLLMLFATGVIGISFPWPGSTSIKLLVALIKSISNWTKVKVMYEGVAMLKNEYTMYKNRQRLTELGDGSAKRFVYHIPKKRLSIGANTIAQFQSDAGLMYKVNLHRIDSDTLFVGFMATDGMVEIFSGLTNKNETWRVMSTLTNMVREVMFANDLDTIAYSPIFNKGDFGVGRDKLYKLFINFAANKMGKRVEYDLRSNDMFYDGSKVADRFVYAKLT